MIWDLLKGSFELLISGVNSIVDFVVNFFTNVIALIKYLFVPSDNYFIDEFNSLKTLFSNKLNIDLSIIENLGSASEINPFKDITFKILGTTVSMDISFLAKAREFTLALSGGLTAIFLCYFHSKKIVWLIRGGNSEE